MKKAGEIFTEERKKQGLFLEEVIKKTKIPKSFVMAIESGNYSKLPKGLYPNLYIKKYAQFLGLSEKRMSAVFRRDYLDFQAEAKKPLLVKIGFIPRWRTILAVGSILFVFVGYLFYQYFHFVYPPKIKVELITSDGLFLEGRTDPRATLKVNDQLVEIKEDGTFSYQIEEDGGDLLTIVAESPSGKKRTVVKEIDFSEN